MKNYILIFLMIFIVSCGNSESVRYDNYKEPLDTYNGPRKWNENAFPITIQIPDEFENDYKTAIENAGNSWNTALGFVVFNFVYENTLNIEPVNFYDSLYDNIFGFYKQNTWSWEGENQQTLASTLTLNQQSKIIHADILFNFKNFNFSDTDNPNLDYSNNYVDMESVIVHELGHFLGLGHNDYPASIMYPSIMKRMKKRQLAPIDITNIKNLYN